MDWRLPGVKEVVAGDGEKGGGYKWAVGGVGGLVFREGSGSGRHQGQHPAARLCPFSNPLPLGGLGVVTKSRPTLPASQQAKQLRSRMLGWQHLLFQKASRPNGRRTSAPKEPLPGFGC